MYRGKGAVLVSCDLMRRLQHLHQEGVDGRVPDELEKEQMLQTFEADGAQGGQAQQQLGKPSKMKMEGKEKKIIHHFYSISFSYLFSYHFRYFSNIFSFSLLPAWLVGVFLFGV